MGDVKDLYRILNVHREAEPEVIRSAFRALTRKYHPDVNRSRDAEEKMKDINEAFEILRDGERRARYDAETVLRAAVQEPAFTPPPPSESRRYEGEYPVYRSHEIMQDVKDLAQQLAHRARFGFRGEKPLALLAVLQAMRSLNITGRSARDMLDSKRDRIREFYLRLAHVWGQMKDPASSWSVINSGGAASEMSRALDGCPEGDLAFARLTAKERDELIWWFEKKLA